MWFNTLKKRSLSKVVEKSTLRALPADFKYEFKEVGILVNKSDTCNVPELIKAIEKKGISGVKIKVLIYTSENKKALEEGYFGMKDFTVSGTTENIEILDFIERRFDILISYYTNKAVPLMWMTAKSNALFKIGVSSENTTLNHFSLALESLEVDNFIENLYKYINVFKH